MDREEHDTITPDDGPLVDNGRGYAVVGEAITADSLMMREGRLDEEAHSTNARLLLRDCPPAMRLFILSILATMDGRQD